MKPLSHRMEILRYRYEWSVGGKRSGEGRGKLSCGHIIAGPAILIQNNSTILVEPNCEAIVTQNADIKIQVGLGDGYGRG